MQRERKWHPRAVHRTVEFSRRASLRPGILPRTSAEEIHAKRFHRDYLESEITQRKHQGYRGEEAQNLDARATPGAWIRARARPHRCLTAEPRAIPIDPLRSWLRHSPNRDRASGSPTYNIRHIKQGRLRCLFGGGTTVSNDHQSTLRDTYKYSHHTLHGPIKSRRTSRYPPFRRRKACSWD